MTETLTVTYMNCGFCTARNHCAACGEDYSPTYRRCPFCDERPGRGGVSGKRVANTRGGGYGRPASALKVAIWIISFTFIAG